MGKVTRRDDVEDTSRQLGSPKVAVMDDLDSDFHHFDFLPGIDLYLWLRLTLLLLLIAALGVGSAALR